ncbi:MAG: DUF418 domain-containing protein [Novosphingobium sp.]|uniref:DUF418 domain-containing protein n=1 Tax=Novosphingobium sp. TaxID=1874826 RepID=UPI003C7D5D1A
MAAAAQDRIRTLDLIRGVAVLGILAVNICGFAAVESALHSPDLPRPGSPADHLAFAFTVVLFDGKMRALFSLLFGASMVLFIGRAEAGGRDGTQLQFRRLGWLMLLGYLHFALLWDGDILFLYAVIGLVALGFSRASTANKLIAAVLALGLWQASNTAMWYPAMAQEMTVRSGHASPAAIKAQAEVTQGYRRQDSERQAEALSSWPGEVALRMADRPAYPLELALYNWGETLSYMLAGMALLQTGFFAGAWPARRLRAVAGAGLVLGGGAGLALVWWGQGAGYPETAMRYWLGYGLAFPRLFMALGYAALLVLAAPRLLATGIGQRLEAAGRMAFSNYIGTSLVMTGLFHGWGLAWFGQEGAAGRWPYVLLGWALMLAASKWWLVRFRQGPLEWLWRSLTEWQRLPLRR